MNHLIIVINYNNYIDTINCVNSLIKLKGNKKILIFDNNSTNNAQEILKKEFINNDNILFCFSDKNLGYSKGIDYAFNYIKEQNIELDFIHTSNSDIIINDLDFLKKVEESYKKTKFFMEGPQVITNGVNTSPIGYFKSKDDFFKELKKLRILAVCLYLFSTITFNLFENKLEGKNNESNAKKTIEKIKKENVVPILSGCYTIFSKDHFLKFNYLYRPLTFLYNEEMIITYTLMNANINKIIFNENLEVIHNHGGSSKGSSKRKAKLIFKNCNKLLKLKD